MCVLLNVAGFAYNILRDAYSWSPNQIAQTLQEAHVPIADWRAHSVKNRQSGASKGMVLAVMVFKDFSLESKTPDGKVPHSDALMALLQVAYDVLLPLQNISHSMFMEASKGNYERAKFFRARGIDPAPPVVPPRTK